MYTLNLKESKKPNLYESFACTCKPEDLQDYKDEFARIVNSEYELTQSFDEIVLRFSYNLIDCINHMLASYDFELTGVFVDQWSMMSIENYDRTILISVQYDEFLFGFVDAYNIIKGVLNEKVI